LLKLFVSDLMISRSNKYKALAENTYPKDPKKTPFRPKRHESRHKKHQKKKGRLKKERELAGAEPTRHEEPMARREIASGRRCQSAARRPETPTAAHKKRRGAGKPRRRPASMATVEGAGNGAPPRFPNGRAWCASGPTDDLQIVRSRPRGGPEAPRRRIQRHP